MIASPSAHARVMATLADGDPAALPDLLAPGHVLHQSIVLVPPKGEPLLPWLVARFREAVSDREVEVADEFADGDRLVTRFVARGRHTGPIGPVAATGEPVRGSGILVSRVDEGGRLVESWLEVSAWRVLADLGVASTVNRVRVVEA